MARITVATDALTQGQFPPVCCKTGVHTDSYTRIRFVETPGWTWILLPFGFLPFLIARMFASTEFDGVLPMSDAVGRRLSTLRRIAIVSGLAGIASMIGGLVAWGWVVAGLSLLAVAAICIVAGTIMSPDARRDLGRGSVEISSVHRRFVETIEAAWAQRGIAP